MRSGIYALMLVLLWTVSVQAATLYLKDGGRVKAKRIWREKGKVVVLVTRESITSFAPSEVNLKKTFPPRKKRIKPVAATTAAVPAPTSATPVQGATPTAGGGGIVPPSLSKTLPERAIPQGTEEGALRKQKRELDERLKE